MNVTVTSMRGFDDMIVTMFISKRHWSPELDRDIRETCDRVLTSDGRLREGAREDDLFKFNDWLAKSLRMGMKHITILRYLDIAIMTEGQHRAGQDDIDAHAKRFDNRIIRNSTRMSEFVQGEVSAFYEDKILTTDQAMSVLGVDVPETIEYDGHRWVKSTNGYVREEYANDKDVKRGLYMLSIPSTFSGKINLCEWGHVFKLRNKEGHAHPEVKQWAEAVTEQIGKYHKQITRDYILSIEN